MKLKRRNAKWEFSIHIDPKKGPNRITHDPDKAERFFKKLINNNPTLNEITLKALHLESNLVWETETPSEFHYFANTIVKSTGLIKNG